MRVDDDGAMCMRNMLIGDVNMMSSMYGDDDVDNMIMIDVMMIV